MSNIEEMVEVSDWVVERFVSFFFNEQMQDYEPEYVIGARRKSDVEIQVFTSCVESLIDDELGLECKIFKEFKEKVPKEVYKVAKNMLGELIMLAFEKLGKRVVKLSFSK